jgi:Rps23 Pro-64 3,4-dihydroxylase Tpa1-like proline 4-hydroxylase
MAVFTNPFDFQSLKDAWTTAKPFSHVVLDDFLTTTAANQIVKEFPAFNDNIWYEYENAIEIKKALNSWDRFGPTTYQLFWFLNSDAFISQLEKLTSCKLYPDFGLNGGGLHTHRSGGKLNTHLDYSLHPKLRLERRLNLITYVTPDWKSEWGGELGLWDHDEESKKPKNLVSTIYPKFNRAVLFDTTQNSWHGLPDPIKCPTDITRNSLAVYYLCEPRSEAIDRNRALFVPHKDQQNDPDVLELIKKRSSTQTSHTVYRTKT